MSNERLNLTPHDFRVQNEGSIVVLHPCNDAARSWIDANLYENSDDEPLTWWGGGVVVEHRFVEEILNGISDAGLTVE